MSSDNRDPPLPDFDNEEDANSQLEDHSRGRRGQKQSKKRAARSEGRNIELICL